MKPNALSGFQRRSEVHYNVGLNHFHLFLKWPPGEKSPLYIKEKEKKRKETPVPSVLMDLVVNIMELIFTYAC